MIRIETEQTNERFDFQSVGTIMRLQRGGAGGVLETRSQRAGKQSVDLTDVTSVDKDGRRLLRFMRNRGVEVSGRGLSSQIILASLVEKEETC